MNTQITPELQWQRTVQLVLSLPRRDWCSSVEEWRERNAKCVLVDDSEFVGIVTRPHRLFLVGDLVYGFQSNGMCIRYPVYAVSSRGYKVMHYYIGVDPNEPGFFVDKNFLPDDLVGKRWDDPAVSRFVDALRVRKPLAG